MFELNVRYVYGKMEISLNEQIILSLQNKIDQLRSQLTAAVFAKHYGKAEVIKYRYIALCRTLDSLSGEQHNYKYKNDNISEMYECSTVKTTLDKM